MKTNKTTGWQAIEAKENNSSVRLNKYADPIEDAREDLTIQDAREIAQIDPSLIYAENL